MLELELKHLSKGLHMKLYLVTPFFAFDCNNIDGFNDGHDVAPFQIAAESKTQALELAIEQQQLMIEKPCIRLDDPAKLYWIESYFEGGYNYQYVDFSNIKEIE